MKYFHVITTLFIATVFVFVVQITPIEAATTFAGTTVEAVDLSKQTLSFKTREGMSWTLHVSNPDLLKKEQLAKGEQVTLEVDTNDNVIKITKLSSISTPAPDPNQMPRD
jgi:hypothetical protein